MGFEIGRMASATGVRGVIDPFGQDNPYRLKNIEDLSPEMQEKVKSISIVTASTAATGAPSEGSENEEEYCKYERTKEPLHSMSSVFAYAESTCE